MAIPQNITKDDLLKAIAKIDLEGIPIGGDSKYYDVIFNNRKYPPKLIVSYGNLFANGKILDRDSFPGGAGTPCFQLLTDNNFQIQKKSPILVEDYFDELKKFISQADTANLKTNSFRKQYSDIVVKVSFGQGIQARIPWIAFVKDGQTVQKGIYPVYLFFKEKQLLILAYGVSETNRPLINWERQNAKTILQYFIDHDLGKPERYGNSFIFKTYTTSKSLDREEINEDLYNLVEAYKKIDFMTQDEILPETPTKLNYLSFLNDSFKADLIFNEKLILRFITSLITKPFVLLTGLAGSGKTKLAQAFACWITQNHDQYCIVSVGADWTNREPLLGFPNSLQRDEYILPDNGVLSLIITATENFGKPYFLILDEMNLSHVERYFADFLSVMESGDAIKLYSGLSRTSSDGRYIPQEINWPHNLFIIGTVNIDETTYMFSPKVLDRANVIEFSVSAKEMDVFLMSTKSPNLSSLKSAGSHMAKNLLDLTINKTLKVNDAEALNHVLVTFFSELKNVGAEFGFRSAVEISRFSAIINILAPDILFARVIDFAIMQKLLPKVHGARRKLEPTLQRLGNLCLHDGYKMVDFLSQQSPVDFEDVSKIKYPISLEKVLRMYHNLISNGFTSYAEA